MRKENIQLNCLMTGFEARALEREERRRGVGKGGERRGEMGSEGEWKREDGSREEWKGEGRRGCQLTLVQVINSQTNNCFKLLPFEIVPRQQTTETVINNGTFKMGRIVI